MLVGPTGNFPILTLILGITALAGLGLTIGGVASDNNTLTAMGLTMVATSALIIGVGAIVAGIGGATLTDIVGGVTAIAGVGTPGGEFHIGTGTTRPLTPVINIFDFARSVYINIPEW